MAMTGSGAFIGVIEICGPAVGSGIGDISEREKGVVISDAVTLSGPGADEKKAGVPKSDGLGAVVALIGYCRRSIGKEAEVSMVRGKGDCWGIP